MEKESRQNNTLEINLSDLWKVFKRAFWLLVAVAILVGGAAYFYMNHTHVDQYQSTATLYVLRTDGRSLIGYNDVAFATAIIDDCEKLILSEDNVVIPAIKKLAGTTYSTAELKERINSILQRVSVRSASADSRIIYITVTSGTADGAAKIANAMALAATEYLNGLMGQNVVNITDAAKAPKSISNPVSMARAGLFGVIAAALIYLIWLVAFLFDDRIDSEEKVEKRLGLTVLGSIPYRGKGSRRRKGRYGTYEGYYGYGTGAEQKKKALSSGETKGEAHK